MTENTRWKAKLVARLHDPAEKALILMRTAEGHEGGTSAALLGELIDRKDRDAVDAAVRKADRWASAADRAAFPKHDDDGRWPAWQNVRFDEQPVLIHPLTGQSFNLGSLTEVAPEQIAAVSLDHFRSLVQPKDIRKTALAFWRFGPELRADALGAVWELAPADTRVPDHTIWDHLDLTSALAGAFVGDDVPALLAVSLGPVQSFIAQARSTSDLWAGSHLLSRMAWEAMCVVCEEFGPDAILFPRLRGVPQIDLWLHKECGLPKELFKECAWMRKGKSTDANPLFAAALPNRFTAIVPASRAREIGEAITRRVQTWAVQQTEAAYRLLLDAADMPDDPALPGYAQIREQLAGFPEVHWAAVPWSLASRGTGDKVEASDEVLAGAMRPFFAEAQPGFLGKPAWQFLSGGLLLEDGWWWRPNPGSLYPALHELLERVLAATKATRTFDQTRQEGWRCSLTGESEWLTTDRDELAFPPGQRPDTLWARVERKRKAWVKAGEHLGALATLKRLWPTLFVAEIKDLVGDVQRFVVSTHTMALAGSLDQWSQRGERLPDDLARDLAEVSQRAALPPRLARGLFKHDDGDALAKIPAWLESTDDSDAEEVKRTQRLKNLLGHKPEAYYALILMDGDQMGAWLSAAPGKTRPHQDSFHPAIRAALRNRFGRDDDFTGYAEALRAPNPAWHMAISEALNHFALTLAPAIVHEQFNGRILYAGGDDLLAMVPVADLLPAMAALRAAYAGIEPKQVGALPGDVSFRQQSSGFVQHRNRVLRVMGDKATASIGAVIAHHQTPLNLVLRELRAAEQRAKNEGGRDAFSITVLKRAGGAQYLTSKWRREHGDSPMACLRELAEAIAGEHTGESARRTAYSARQWMVDLPDANSVGGEQPWRAMLQQLLAAQFKRQKLDEAGVHARRLAELVPLKAGTDDNGKTQSGTLDYIDQFLAVAEFLAREGRVQGDTP